MYSQFAPTLNQSKELHIAAIHVLASATGIRNIPRQAGPLRYNSLGRLLSIWDIMCKVSAMPSVVVF